MIYRVLSHFGSDRRTFNITPTQENRAMAESQGTWVKLGEQSCRFVPREIKQLAHKLDLTWETTATIAKPLNSTMEPSDEAIKVLGMYHMHNRVSLKPRDATRDSIEIVEISPRSASTAKVKSAIRLTPAANVEVPPGDFSPPGNFNVPIDKPSGNFNQPASSSWNTTPQFPTNHGVALVPINHGEEEDGQTTKSVFGVNTWWSASDISMYLSNEKPGAFMWNPCNALSLIHI